MSSKAHRKLLIRILDEHQNIWFGPDDCYRCCRCRGNAMVIALGDRIPFQRYRYGFGF
jgi:hypothetical protein